MAKCRLHQGRGRPPKDCIACAGLRALEEPKPSEARQRPQKAQVTVETRREVKTVYVAPSPSVRPPRKPIIPGKPADHPLIDKKLRHAYVPSPSYPEFGWCQAPGCIAPRDSAIHANEKGVSL